MKSWQNLISRLKAKTSWLQQKGQALVEFILLLVAIASISFGFVSLMNRNLGRYWEYYANLIINDRPNVKTVNLRR